MLVEDGKERTIGPVVLRLSERDRHFILVGLNWIAGNYQLWANKRQLPNRRLDRVWAPNLDTGTYDQDLMDGILALKTMVSSLGPTGRLRFEASYQVAACSLAVRIAVRRHAHGHFNPNISRIGPSSKRLLRRLEAVRKRAKRVEIRRSGPINYRQSAGEWRRFVHWLRFHFLDCDCSSKRRTPPLQSRRIIIDELVPGVRAELIDRNEKLPSERELRRLIRLALRYMRHGRTGHDVRDLLSDKLNAAIRLATFVSIRLEKAARRVSNPVKVRNTDGKPVRFPKLDITTYDSTID